MNAMLSEVRHHGLRITRPRRLVAGELSATPLTAQEIHGRIIRKRQRIDLVSVYRILDTFTGLGIAKEVTLGDGNTRYERSEGNHHHHLICTVCGNVNDIEMNEDLLLSEISRKSDFSVTRHLLEFFGVCGACQRSRS